MKPKKVQLKVYVTERARKAVREVSREEGISQSQLMEELALGLLTDGDKA